MTSRCVLPKSTGVCLSLAVLFTLTSTIFSNPLCAITISVGVPYRGSLVNGIEFPSDLHGYRLGDKDRSYTTPEVVGALIEAFGRFEQRYPDSCDEFLGDFSRRGGGRFKGHGSHQNGRDVDMGLFAKGNTQLDSFIPMNSKNLDVSKTWHMIQCLLGTHLVEHIYLDRTIQAQLYRQALSEGDNPDYLSKVFRNAGSGEEKECIIQHEPGHRNHMHVRFSAPWSTLAGQTKVLDTQQRMTIETAQASYLSQRVDYYARNGGDLNQLKVATPASLSQVLGSGRQLANTGSEYGPLRVRRSYTTHKN